MLLLSLLDYDTSKYNIYKYIVSKSEAYNKWVIQ